MRYSVPDFVEKLQDGCNNLLKHWKYFNCRPWPTLEATSTTTKSCVDNLLPEQSEQIVLTLRDSHIQSHLAAWKFYRKHNGASKCPLEAVSHESLSLTLFQSPRPSRCPSKRTLLPTRALRVNSTGMISIIGSPSCLTRTGARMPLISGSRQTTKQSLGDADSRRG